MRQGIVKRLMGEASQAWTVAVKDIRVYYLKPSMIISRRDPRLGLVKRPAPDAV